MRVDEPALSLFEEPAELTLAEKIRAIIDEIKKLDLDKSTPGPWLLNNNQPETLAV